MISWNINKATRVTVMTPILLMFCAKTNLMGETSSFHWIRDLTWFWHTYYIYEALKTKHRLGSLTEIKTGCYCSAVFRTILTNFFLSLLLFFLILIIFFSFSFYAIYVCSRRLWICGLWQPCSCPEGCGLAQSQWSPGTDGEGKHQPALHCLLCFTWWWLKCLAFL